MRIIRLYCDPNESCIAPGYQGCLGDRNTNYLKNVLRAKQGQALCLFDGLGNEYAAYVSKVDRRSVSVLVESSIAAEVQSESPLDIGLAIGLSKGDRMDYVMQKATELGVKRLQPLYTTNVDLKLDNNRMQKKLQHWRAVVVSACEQSGRSWLPVVEEPITLDAFLNLRDTGEKILFHPTGQPVSELKEKKSLRAERDGNKIDILIGPEGGFSDAECANAQAGGARIYSLGPRILRTETAPVVVLSLMQFLWGDF